jgi:hypothetical protein
MPIESSPNPDAAPAASSPAPDPSPAAPRDLDSLSETELHDWRMTGEFPDSSSVTTPPVASSATPAVPDPPASTDAPPQAASEPADPEPHPRTKARMEELLADRKRERERAERAEQRARDLETRRPPPVEARPAAPPAAPAGPVKPNPETFTYGTADPAYLEALTDYKVATTLASERSTWEQQQQEARQQAEQQRVVSGFHEKAAAARATHPDFDAVALLAPTEIPQGSPADLWILEDEAGAEILYHLQQPAQTAERRRILALGPREQLKALVRLGDRLTAPAGPPASSTSVPPPPPVLSSRATPTDPVERALAEGTDDAATARYIAAANARELRLKKA